MSTSTAPAVKAALKGLLAPRLAPHGVEVYRGAPPSSAGDSLAIVGNARGTQEFRALGARSKDEDYEVDVFFQAHTAADGQDAVSEKAYTLLAELENGLREDPTLGGACQVAHVSGWEDSEEPAAQGWLCSVTATVSVRARI